MTPVSEMNGLVFHPSRNHKGWPGQTGSDINQLTSIPWREGHSATWDVTVTNTVAASYVAITSARAAPAAEAAAQRKEIKYAEIAQTHLFYRLSFETMGPINVVGLEFIMIWVIESLESVMIHERLHLCFNAFQQPFSVSTQSFFQILSATPMTTPQAFRSTPIGCIFYNNLPNITSQL